MTLLNLRYTDSVMLPGNRAASLLTHQPLSPTVSLTVLGGWRLSVRGCTPLMDTAPIVMLGSLPCSLLSAHRIHMQYNALLGYHFAGGRMASSRARKVNLSRSQTHPTLLLAWGKEHGRRSWMKRHDAAGWCTKGTSGYPWEQNNPYGMVATASNSFGIVWNHSLFKSYCHGVRISTTAHPDPKA